MLERRADGVFQLWLSGESEEREVFKFFCFFFQSQRGGYIWHEKPHQPKVYERPNIFWSSMVNLKWWKLGSHFAYISISKHTFPTIFLENKMCYIGWSWFGWQSITIDFPKHFRACHNVSTALITITDKNGKRRELKIAINASNVLSTSHIRSPLFLNNDYLTHNQYNVAHH